MPDKEPAEPDVVAAEYRIREPAFPPVPVTADLPAHGRERCHTSAANPRHQATTDVTMAIR